MSRKWGETLYSQARNLVQQVMKNGEPFDSRNSKLSEAANMLNIVLKKCATTRTMYWDAAMLFCEICSLCNQPQSLYSEYKQRLLDDPCLPVFHLLKLKLLDKHDYNEDKDLKELYDNHLTPNEMLALQAMNTQDIASVHQCASSEKPGCVVAYGSAFIYRWDWSGQARQLASQLQSCRLEDDRAQLLRTLMGAKKLLKKSQLPQELIDLYWLTAFFVFVKVGYAKACSHALLMLDKFRVPHYHFTALGTLTYLGGDRDFARVQFRYLRGKKGSRFFEECLNALQVLGVPATVVSGKETQEGNAFAQVKVKQDENL